MADLLNFINKQNPDINDPTRPLLTSVLSVTTEPSRDVVKPFHKSLVDWLSEEGKAGLYFASMREGHRMLAAFCSSKWQAGDSFALENLVYHLRSTENFEELAQVVLSVQFHQMKSSASGGSLGDLLLAEVGAKGRLGLAAACFAACEHVEHVSLSAALEASAQWMNDGVAAKASAEFALKVLDSFQSERPESAQTVAAKRQNSWTTNWLDQPESVQAIAALRDYLTTQGDFAILERARDVLKPKLTHAKLAPRRVAEPVSSHTAHTAHFYEDYLETSLEAIDAALALESGRLVLKLTAASQFKAAYDCDGDPVCAFTNARFDAINEVNMRLAGLLRPRIAFSSSEVSKLQVP